MFRAVLPILAVILALVAAGAAGQQTLGLVPDHVVDPPRRAEGEAVARQARQQGIDTDMVYAQGATGKGAPLPRQPTSPSPGPQLGIEGSAPVWAVVLVLLAVLFLWLRFGGGGALFARNPTPTPANKTEAPAAWNMASADALRGPADLLDMIAAMPDRSAALVRLLHHCLLRAGTESHTRFARADTEREALARIPQHWRNLSALGLLLQSAEIAHYGGRPVDDAGFRQALEAGREILLAQGAR